MTIPEGILCSKTHEWVLDAQDNAVVGLTDWAVEQLGDIVFVELPEVGSTYSKDETFATLDIMAIDLYSGNIEYINVKLGNF